MSAEGKIGVVLLNLGAPDRLEAIKPFLTNLFNDPDILEIPFGRFLRPVLARYIISKRLPEATEIYRQIGGGSPLRKWTERQARLLEERLNEKGDYIVFTMMRYWEPSAGDVLKKIIDEKLSRVVLLPLYPQYSGTTTGSSVNEWKRVLRRSEANGLDWRLIEEYHDEGSYLNSLLVNINRGLEKFGSESEEEITLLFSAHGVPVKTIENGDPYERQVIKTVDSLVAALGNRYPYRISFQSKVGRMKWLEPSTQDTIKELGESGVKNLLVVPVSFVSDHSETLWELDIFNRKIALESGIEKYEVMPALNDSPDFIDALRGLVLRKVESWES